MRVLVVKTSSMGDVIHTLPALTDAARQIYDISFDWVVEEGFAAIPIWHRSVGKVLPVAIRRWRKDWLAAFRQQEITHFLHELRCERYDHVIDAQGLLKSAGITMAARGLKHGFDYRYAREPLSACFYQCRHRVERNQHAITRVRQLFAQALKYTIPDTAPDYGIELELPSNHSGSVVAVAQPYLVFVHGTSRADKCWSEANWLALAKLANQVGFAVKLPWGNQTELLRAESLAAAGDGIIVLPQLTLTAIGDILSQAHGVVAVDTGLGHLAAALSVPTVSLYGPTDCRLVGTCGSRQQHLLDLAQLSPVTVWNALQELMRP